MTPCGEQSAAAILLEGVPAELAVPGADAVIVIHFSIMQITQEALINHSLGADELATEAALEAHAAFDVVLLRSFHDGAAVGDVHRHRLLDDEVLACVGCRDGLILVLAWVAGNIHHMDRRIGQHLVEIGVALDRRAVLRCQFCIVKLAR